MGAVPLGVYAVSGLWVLEIGTPVRVPYPALAGARNGPDQLVFLGVLGVPRASTACGFIFYPAFFIALIGVCFSGSLET